MTTPINRMISAKILKKGNQSVASVTNGLEAFKYTNGQALDLIFMDIQMPEMDRLTANKIIRAGASQNKNIPIIALTANLAKTDRAKVLRPTSMALFLHHSATNS
jgi:CheY-like chemotaxis protein